MHWVKRLPKLAWSNFDKVALLAGWVMSVTLPPWLLSFSKGATPIEYFAVVGLTIVGIVLIWAASARATLWRIEARRIAKIEGDSSRFDPMAMVYQDKRLYLRDLAPLGRRQVVQKKFLNCEIIGPGTIMVGLRSSDQLPFPIMKDTHTFDVDCIEVDPSPGPGRGSQLAVSFVDCDFEGCRFYHLTLLFTGRDNENLNWITPDFRQLHLIGA